MSNINPLRGGRIQKKLAQLYYKIKSKKKVILTISVSTIFGILIMLVGTKCNPPLSTFLFSIGSSLVMAGSLTLILEVIGYEMVLGFFFDVIWKIGPYVKLIHAYSKDTIDIIFGRLFPFSYIDMKIGFYEEKDIIYICTKNLSNEPSIKVDIYIYAIKDDIERIFNIKKLKGEKSSIRIISKKYKNLDNPFSYYFLFKRGSFIDSIKIYSANIDDVALCNNPLINEIIEDSSELLEDNIYEHNINVYKLYLIGSSDKALLETNITCKDLSNKTIIILIKLNKSIRDIKIDEPKELFYLFIGKKIIRRLIFEEGHRLGIITSPPLHEIKARSLHINVGPHVILKFIIRY